jgi:hypothetical protein
MKKKDLVETTILLLGLWFIYQCISGVIPFLLNLSLNFFYSDYSEQVSRAIMVESIYAICYAIGAWVCFRRTEWLIENTGLNSQEETLVWENLITKRDVLETGIVIVSFALIFYTLPLLLKNFLFFFQSRAGNQYVDYEFTYPFLLLVVPVIAIIMRDKLTDLIYSKPRKNQ